jgi:DNA-binding transcriptional LysR family regulator
VQLQQVLYFLAICEDKSFTQAAKRCGATQPSVTMAIQRLERELGAALFERQPVKLTEFGRSMRPGLEQAAASLDRVRNNAKVFLRRV